MKKYVLALCLSVSAVFGASAQAVEYTLQLSGGCQGDVYINIGEPTDLNEIVPVGSVYPNPVADVLNVPVAASGRDVNLLLMDAGGKLLQQTLVRAGSESIRRLVMTNYPAGIYFLLVIDTKETIYKVIKN
jgi:hypothetical protein